MPAGLALRAAVLGAVVGFFPIGWIVLDAQSIVVASTATNWFGHEGSILRFVFFHSIALACLVGILVTLQAYVFIGMVVH